MAHHSKRFLLGMISLIYVLGLGACHLGCSSDSATQPEDPIVNQPPVPRGTGSDKGADLDHAPDPGQPIVRQ